MFTNQRRCHHVKLLERYYSIRFPLSRDIRNQIDYQGWSGVVWHRDQVIETVTWPVFLKHFFLGDKDDIAAVTLTLTNKVAAFKIGGQADDVDWRIHRSPKSKVESQKRIHEFRLEFTKSDSCGSWIGSLC